MSDSIRIWSVDGEALAELPRQPVDLESRLEDWMDADVSVLSDDLLVIGRQLDTEGGGTLDLLCLDRNGDVVVVELKRGKTPREVVAQVLDYAAWAADLSFDQIQSIASDTFPEGLDHAFRQRFDADLPDVLNADHYLLVVASEIDSRSERIIRYLAETHGVRINAVTFNYFRADDGGEFLARTHLIEPDIAEERTERPTGSKRRRRPTLEDHRQAAERAGVGAQFDLIVEGLRPWLTPVSNVTLLTLENADKKATANVVPNESSPEGGLRVNLYINRFSLAAGIPADDVLALLPPSTEPWSFAPDAASWGPEWEGKTCLFRDANAVRRFVDGLTERANS